ncbi:rhomboid family intramembrane serine protease [Flavobacterium difficile]|uniref:Rhomboid family intramembrane serine protease n=1 Tax=Flavobacterium difficile TaxID=2709659 RepID=A0ABX0I127_9FLAO|nr:rhomboid family intramembrane serine protease [Flavobacterium difficile]NHM00908.1 rhomboid family intramembrane serine protease [Flavobacterium difficile]
MNLFNDIKQHYKSGDVSQKLIFINILVFILSAFIFSFASNQFQYPSWLALSSNYEDVIWFPWTLLTYGFLHSEIIHLIFNLIFLYYISILFYTFFNTRQFLTVYFLGSFFAGLVFVAYGFFFNYDNLIVGASASIMAIFMAVATYAPNYNIRLPLIGYVKIWHLAALYVFIDVSQLLTENTGGHIAHLSGSIAGFIFAILMKKGIDLSEVFLFKKRKNTTFKKVYKNKPVKKYQSVRVSDVNFQQRQIDEILEKISKSGYDSLTKEEKEFLFAANK